MLSPHRPASNTSIRHRPLFVGLAGGIGAGKSTVAQVFEQLGIPVYYADLRARDLMQSDNHLIHQIRLLFGPQAYHSSGTLNRDYLRARIFSSPKDKAQLERLVHPRVYTDFALWGQQQQSPYVLLESAILCSSRGTQHLDGLIYVDAPRSLRLLRVVRHRGIPAQAVEAIMQSQQLEEQLCRARADFLIRNDGQHSLIRRVCAVHRRLLTWPPRNRRNSL